MHAPHPAAPSWFAVAIACGRADHRRAYPAPTVIVAIPNLPDDLTAPVEPTLDDTANADGSVDVRKTGHETLDDLFRQDDPTGTVPQIALPARPRAPAA